MNMNEDIGGLIDNLYLLRAERLEANRKVEEMKKEEKILSDQLVSILSGVGLESAKGYKASFGLRNEVVPNVKDWNKLYEFIRVNNAFEILNRAINILTWRGFREDGIIIPGTVEFEMTKTTLTKR